MSRLGIAALMLLLVLCAGAKGDEQPAAEEKKEAQVEFKVRTKIDTDDDTAIVQFHDGKKWKEVVKEQMTKMPRYAGRDIVVPYVHKDHREFFPEKQRDPVKGVAVLVVVQQHHIVDMKFDGDTKEPIGVVICVHSYQFVLSKEGKILKRGKSGSRHVQQLRRLKPGKEPDKAAKDGTS